jgi:hypothetical protein
VIGQGKLPSGRGKVPYKHAMHKCDKNKHVHECTHSHAKWKK